MKERKDTKKQEAILKARMERKAAREAAIKEREERKKERELRKQERLKLAEERAKRKAAKEAKLKKLPKHSDQWDENSRKVSAIPPWKGPVAVGDEVAFRFTGYIFHGKVTAIEDENLYSAKVDDEGVEEEDVSLGTARIYSIFVEGDRTTYPVLKKDILAKKLK